jgi:PAS domain S-box-containing protein
VHGQREGGDGGKRRVPVRPVAAMNSASGEATGLVTSVGQVPAERLRTIFDGMFDGVWLVSPEGTTTYANGAMAELLGTTPEAMRDREITEFMDPEQWAVMTGFLERQRRHAGERMELRPRMTSSSGQCSMSAT